jgi:hypothetical protein
MKESPPDWNQAAVYQLRAEDAGQASRSDPVWRSVAKQESFPGCSTGYAVPS